MRFYFHPEAEREFNQAIQYYEARGAGLGLEFAEEVYSAISRVVEFPDALDELVVEHEAVPRQPVSFRLDISDQQRHSSDRRRRQPSSPARLLTGPRLS